MNAWVRTVVQAARTIDHAVGRAAGTRRVLVDVRNAMHVAVLAPITTVLASDPRVQLWFTSARPVAVDAALGRVPASRRISHRGAALRRWDLYLSADPWARPTLHRCARMANVFHGVAGKYDLDDPAHLPIEYQAFDCVMFINGERRDRYVSSGLVAPDRAALIGFPKLDPLVNGDYDVDAVRSRLGLERHRPTALYAPTWSVASSLHIAGEQIIRTLADEGLNVIVKLHPLSLDPGVEKYSGGIDWRARMDRLVRPGRIVHVEDPDATPLLAASDLLVTDHSTIGFEFCLLDRPVIVFDTPDLIAVARINEQKVRQLRTAARVVGSEAALRRAVSDALACPEQQRDERLALARSMFFDPGRATERALAATYRLLELQPRPTHVPSRANADREQMYAIRN